MDVVQVANEFGVAAMRERIGGHTGLAMIDAGHRVEEMCEARQAAAERGGRLFEGGEAVAGLNAAAPRRQCFDDFEASWDLRGDRRHRESARISPFHRLSDVAVEGRIELCAELPWVDERPLEMRADHCRFVGAA
jgi:hypothetical protein